MAGIFKAYDIRGVYGEILNRKTGYRIGLGFANLIGAGKSIVCGRDGRTHSPELQTAFIEGALDGGVHVTDMGLATTPQTYFACFSGGYDGATMITASHNPGQYNGMKFCGADAVPIGFAEGLDRVERALADNELEQASTRGQFTSKDFKGTYLDWLARRCSLSRQFSFAVDCGNGMAGYLIGDFLDRIGQKAHPLYWDLDFSFPNHEANPLIAENLRDLQARVKEKGLDFGVAFDGDADRCFFIDELGGIVPADLLTALIAVDVLDKEGGGAIIYDIRGSRIVAERIREHGGTPVLSRVGHTFIKAMLRKYDAPFGGELAGHFYYRDFSYADSAFLTLVTVMQLLDKTGQTLSELLLPYKKYMASGEINFRTEKADYFIETAAERFPGGEVTTIDGIRIDFPDWWFCLRKSNTEPLLRLVAEADVQQTLENRVGALRAWLQDAGAEQE